MFLFALSAAWLVGSSLEIGYGLALELHADRCWKGERVEHTFEALLFGRSNTFAMVGPDGRPFPGWEGPWPVAQEIAACFPDRVTSNRLRLPEGVHPVRFQDAVVAGFRVARGETDEVYARNADYYPMNTATAPCVLEATKRLHRQAVVTAPTRSPQCRVVVLRSLGHWLLTGWSPLLGFFGILIAVRSYLVR